MYSVKNQEINPVFVPSEIISEWTEKHNERIQMLNAVLNSNQIYWLIDFDNHTIFATALDKLQIEQTAEQNNCTPMEICMDIMVKNNDAEQMLLSYYKIGNRK
jgi:hypothetical protein